MKANLKAGFTLIEILVTTVIVFMLFSLVYMTFFSVSRLTAELRKNIRVSEVMFGFLNKFYEEGKSFIAGKEPETVFLQKELAFICKGGGEEYPYYVKYAVESDSSGDTLIRRQQNLPGGYAFTLPVLENCESVDFMFYDGESWNYSVDDKDKIAAVAVEIYYGGEKIFYPVELPANEQNLEKQ